MVLPAWVEQDLKKLPPNHTGRVIIEVWEGGVTRIELRISKKAPRGLDIKK